MSDVRLEPISAPFDVTFTPPGSKSLTNRALVMAALADGTCELRNVLFADDTHVMIDSLGRLGFRVEVDRATNTVHVHGAGGRIPRGEAELFVGNSGTTVRFLTALCTLGNGEYSLDGIARMRERPIGPLVEMLRNLGARITSTMNDGFPPVRITAHGLPGGHVRFRAESSSQFLSAVLMTAPYARHEVRVLLDPNQTSWPYVEMTMRLMDEFGIICELERDPDTREPKSITVPHGRYASTQYDVEPDASNASYFLALAAVHPGSAITLNGLGTASLQGDAAFDGVLKKLGCEVTRGPNTIRVVGPARLRGIDVDMSPMPDTVQTLGVVALFCEGPTTMRGLHTLRVKETDRIAALEAELTKLGARVEVDGDAAMTIHPPATLTPAAIDTYDDHRMAMSFAVAATRAPGVLIRNAECVNKTYPGFFVDLRRLLAR
jgi:3-phosphoshikimate 1-carboxyvinyltransferase